MKGTQKPNIWMWITVLLFATVFYVLSLPVYAYVARKGYVPRWCHAPAYVLYSPCVIIYDQAPEPFYGLGQAYLQYWMRP